MIMNGIPPFLDNIETVGIKPKMNSQAEDWKKQVLRNRKRGYLHSEGAAVNKRVYNELNGYLHSKTIFELSEDSLKQFTLLRSRLQECCKHGLYREFTEGGGLEFIAAHTCNHKYCFVCNKLRSKTIRRKFVKFFEAYPEVRQQYDFMHLTLTVPHTESGWKGKKFYASELMEAFNFMRKSSWWKKLVFAGEFGVEITKNSNGLHIHIHSLLLVEKSRGSRNELHRKIFLHWNKSTAEGEFQPIDDATWELIKKSNKTFENMDRAKINRNGATLIGLESLYVLSNKQKKGYKYCERSESWKRYINPNDDNEFLAGLLECIKYHFEPSGMYLNEGKLDFELLNEILPAIYRKPLYRKFGAFHTSTKNAHPGAAMLNFNVKDSAKEETLEALAETANDTVINPVTGKEAGRDEYNFTVMACNKVWYDKENEYLPKVYPNVKRRHLPSWTVANALLEMLIMSVPGIERKSRTYK